MGSYFNIEDLRGGVNDSDSPFSLADNQVVQALNVDFREGMIASKRKGMAPFALTNSIFSRDLPVMQTSNQGGFTAAAGGALAVSAGVNDDGTGTANHILIVRITTKAATDVTAVDHGGTALTQVGESSNANAGRLEVWRLHNPSLNALNLNVTLAGAADCSIIVERWSRVDVASGIQNFAIANDTASFTVPTNANWNAQFIAQIAVAWRNTGTATNNGAAWNYNSIQQSNGTARVLGASALGMKPNTGFAVIFSINDNLVVATWAWRGRAVAAGTTSTRIVALMRHTPTNLVSGDELWAQDNFGRLDRYVSGAWQTGVPMAYFGGGSAFTSGLNGTNGTSLHGKFFLALDGTLAGDVLQLWDGTQLRYAGCITPGSPAFVNTAAGGTFATTRYYRVRTAEYQGSVCVRRSEPGAVQTFVPSGANTGAQWTVGASPIGQYLTGFNGETHYEIEASVDNVLFYRIGTQAIVAGGVFTDTQAYNATSTYVAFTLSENIGEYTRPLAARHVTVDGDRLIMAGSVVSPTLDSRVQWSVLRADLGVGNDERVPITSRFFVDIDDRRGGAITYMSSGSSGAVYTFKQQMIHKLVRTGTSSKAYDTVIESEQRGCLLRAGCNGIDENGLPAIYFNDPNAGLCRFGVRGVEDLAQPRRLLVQRYTKSAKFYRVLFNPKHWLVWATVCLDGGTTPTRLMCFNIRTRSWTDYTGPMATTLAGVMFPDATEALAPLLAPQTLGTGLLCTADSGTNDDGVQFRGFLTTKPYQAGKLYASFGVLGAALMARCSAASVNVALIRNYGVERKETETKSLAAAVGETSTAQPFDDAVMSECRVVQFELGDPLAFAGAQLDQTWTLDELAVKYRPEGEFVG